MYLSLYSIILTILNFIPWVGVVDTRSRRESCIFCVHVTRIHFFAYKENMGFTFLTYMTQLELHLSYPLWCYIFPFSLNLEYTFKRVFDVIVCHWLCVVGKDGGLWPEQMLIIQFLTPTSFRSIKLTTSAHYTTWSAYKQNLALTIPLGSN